MAADVAEEVGGAVSSPVVEAVGPVEEAEEVSACTDVSVIAVETTVASGGSKQLAIDRTAMELGMKRRLCDRTAR